MCVVSSQYKEYDNNYEQEMSGQVHYIGYHSSGTYMLYMYMEGCGLQCTYMKCTYCVTREVSGVNYSFTSFQYGLYRVLRIVCNHGIVASGKHCGNTTQQYNHTSKAKLHTSVTKKASSE